ncbi:MAG TPA: hypothetical protein VFW89_04165 [Gemmatimonadaceae bacterium]|nr:hypothetical protein [Gemmatimonadaceae bacterium]
MTAADLGPLAARFWRMPDSIAEAGMYDPISPLARCWKVGPVASTVLAWLAILARHTPGARWSDPVDTTHARLAALCRADRKNVNTALAGLVGAGLVARERRAHQHYPRAHTYRYRVLGCLYAAPWQRFTCIYGRDLFNDTGAVLERHWTRHTERHLWLTRRALETVKDPIAYQDALHGAGTDDPEGTLADRRVAGRPSLMRIAGASGVNRNVVARCHHLPL